jgi:hypothetical protein
MWSALTLTSVAGIGCTLANAMPKIHKNSRHGAGRPATLAYGSLLAARGRDPHLALAESEHLRCRRSLSDADIYRHSQCLGYRGMEQLT